MSVSKQYIGAVAVAVPPLVIKQSDALSFIKKNYSRKLSKRSLAIVEKVFLHPSITERHFASKDLECLISENADQRITRFTEQALELSVQAAVKAMRQAHVSTSEITGIVVNTCTGYICPGLSTYLIEKLGLKRTIRAYDLVGSGCGGALPNLQICQAFLGEQPVGVILSISVEICSATFQMGDDLSLIISNAIFGDGAAAAIIWNRPKGFKLTAFTTTFLPEYRDDIRYRYQDGQLHNQLSLRLPELVSVTVKKLICEFLQDLNLSQGAIDLWVIHPGGEKIIDGISIGLNLTAEQISPTKKIMSKFGNMSSPTVWFILAEQMPKLKPKDRVMMIAFGAGFSAYACLLEAGGQLT